MKVSKKHNRFLIRGEYDPVSLKKALVCIFLYCRRRLYQNVSIVFEPYRMSDSVKKLLHTFFQRLHRLSGDAEIEIRWIFGFDEDVNNAGLEFQGLFDLRFELIRKAEKKILLVDPDPFMKELMILFYLNMEIDLHYAADGKQAKKLIAENHFDMLITELKLTYFSGWELITKVYESKNPETFVVVISDKNAIKENEKTLIRNGVFYQSKPLDLLAFNTKIIDLLKKDRHGRLAS